MSEYVPSAPRLFRLVERSFLAGLALLLVLAWLVPAPLEPPADPAHPPNPAKSAWFLLWIQELVSWGTPAIYLALAFAAFFAALPWLPARAVERASWFPREQRALGAAVVAIALVVLALTLVGLFLRGPDWSLVSPF